MDDIYLLDSLYIDKSRIADCGIFTSKLIKKDTILYNCTNPDKYGRFLSFSDIDSLDEKNKNEYLRFAYQIDDDKWFGPNIMKFSDEFGKSNNKSDNDLSIYWNHSCNPNTYFMSEFKIGALCDIQAGEELTYDYCTTDSFIFPPHYNIYFPYAKQCKCGAINCRGTVSPMDWTIPILQEKYIFLPYIAKKINTQ